MTNDSIKVTGRLKVDLYRDGKLVKEGTWRDNVVTTAGKNALASLLNSSNTGQNTVTHMGFGTSATAVAVGDTQLGSEISGNGYSRVAVTRSNPSANVIQYVATLSGLTVSTTVQEAGILSAATGGTLFAHQLTGAVTLATNLDSLQITWQVTFN